MGRKGRIQIVKCQSKLNMVTRVTRKSKKDETRLEKTVENMSATAWVSLVTRETIEPAAVWS